jgi:SAM-dependent methyltransferase
MDVVDLGCGPGSITLGLAEAVAPGMVVAIDVDATTIERARGLAVERGIGNVRFELGSAYDVPLASGSADAVCLFNVLQHLADPLRALGEARRLLRPGGIVAVRTNDHGTAERPSWIVWPSDSALDEALRLYLRLWQRKGGAPDMARRSRALLHEAGFVRVEAMASASAYGTPEEVAQWGEQMASTQETASDLITLGLADQATIERVAAGCRAWGARPDAFVAIPQVAALGWID